MTDYTPRTYGLGFSITSELTEPQRLMNQMQSEMARWIAMKTEIEMGMPLSNEDARYLLASLEEANRKLAERPAPTMLNTMRKWLAAKIRPVDDDNYDY